MSSLFKGGRLRPVRKDVVRFTTSIKDDKKLLNSVISINKAHVVMMMEQRILDWSTGVELLKALNELKPSMRVRSGVEDIHLSIEEEVIKKTGQDIGGNLHIGKSRNDQVCTAIRMTMRQDLLRLTGSIVTLQDTLARLAKKHFKTVIPGFTHLQPAQPVTFAHYLLSNNDMLERGLARIKETYERVNLCPLGAGALATSSFPVQRERTAELLGFNGLLENSIDAVGSRDFILETLADLTLIALDISRLCEDLIVWGSPHFHIIEFPDNFSSTSSIMPQKKNPDVLEVIRARMSHVAGNFVASAMTVKSLPSSYNMDFQEITPWLWESLKEVTDSFDMLSKFIRHMQISQGILDQPFLGFSTSTELVNMLTRKCHVSFRLAHRIVGALMRHLIENDLTLADVTPELLQTVARDFEFPQMHVEAEDIDKSTDPYEFVEAHKVRGGPSPVEVQRMAVTREKAHSLSRKWSLERASELDAADEKLHSIIRLYMKGNNQKINPQV